MSAACMSIKSMIRPSFHIGQKWPMESHARPEIEEKTVEGAWLWGPEAQLIVLTGANYMMERVA